MRRMLSLVAIGALVLSCSTKKDEKFCSCLEASKKLNDHTEKMLQKSSYSDEDRAALTNLQVEKDKSCEDYKEISAEESSELRTACEEN
ncbi:MAG: hypothetical protein EP322_05470 [Bacteroidetes bacterium]|nr:MAG: hypothetical protein EP322_05470 [Bacteroidota bacterium]